MDSVNLKEARRRLGALVGAAERGEATVITRRGRPAARLVPLERRRLKRLPDLTAFRASIKVKGRPLSQMVIEGRREERY